MKKFYRIILLIVIFTFITTYTPKKHDYNEKENNVFFIIKKIEKKLGRKKSNLNSPRTCDIDILDYNGFVYNLQINHKKLIIPHARLHNRNFVLFPLYEIEKGWKHPLKKTKIQDLIRKLDNYSLSSIKQI